MISDGKQEWWVWKTGHLKWDNDVESIWEWTALGETKSKGPVE